MLNTITLMGRLTRNPELRYTKSNVPVASFTIAVDRDFQKNETDFVECVAWRNTGEFIDKYFQKGQMIVATGSLQSRRWEDRDGNKRISWEVNVEHAYFGEQKRETRSESYGTQRPTERRGYGDPNVSAGGFEDLAPGAGDGNPFVGGDQMGMEDDGELPF